MRPRRGPAIGAIRGFLADPVNILAIVLLAAAVSRVIWIWLPQGSLIFDEAYYVNASRVIDGFPIPAGGNYADAPLGLDPNIEHPPLGKVAIAASMALAGDNAIGWRTPSLIAGMVALLALYGIVRAGGGSARLGVLAVFLLSADNLSLVHGRVATLDMLSLAPILVGAYFAMRGRWTVAGVACAVGALVKLTAGFGLLALVLMQCVTLSQEWREKRGLKPADLRPLVALLASFGVVFAGGLWLLDLRFTSFSDPLAHLSHMLSYGSSLQTQGGPSGIASYPWQWLVNEIQIPYLRVAVDTSVNGAVVSSRPTVDFRGALNPVLIGVAPLAFGFVASLAWRSHDRLATWCVAWTIATYLPYYLLVLLDQRITYLYYFLPVVPALAVSVALLLRRSNLPRVATATYLGAIVLGFIAYFPFRQLP